MESFATTLERKYVLFSLDLELEFDDGHLIAWECKK